MSLGFNTTIPLILSAFEGHIEKVRGKLFENTRYNDHNLSIILKVMFKELLFQFWE